MRKSWDMQDIPIDPECRRGARRKTGPSSHSCCCVVKQRAFLALCLLGMATLYCAGPQSSLKSQQLSGAMVGDASPVSANATTSCVSFAKAHGCRPRTSYTWPSTGYRRPSRAATRPRSRLCRRGYGQGCIFNTMLDDLTLRCLEMTPVTDA